MERKWFDCSKKGFSFSELEKEYPDMKEVLLVVRDGKIYMTSGDNLTKEEKEEYELK